MNVKRLFAAVSSVVVLAVAGFVIGPGADAPIVVQIAGVIAPSATPTATNTPTPTSTPTPTNTPTSTPTPTPTFTPSPTPTRAPRVARVPILMYHYISVPPPDADKYRLDLSVTPDALDAQMGYLAAQGYHPIRISELSDYLLHGTPLPPKPIALTFDDGYLDNYQNALPILLKYNFTATFFIITQFVDDRRPGYMTWDQIKELATAGMEIGSHTLNHISLRGRSRAVQTSEIVGSKMMIEDRIGAPVKSFCYPSGEYDAVTISILRSAGYLAATTEIQGTYQSERSIYELRRVRIRGSYSVADFAHWLNYFLTSGK
jgi:peptidoglycan/xylan/chitin deacetylase (PgdA/CDA1 family)